MSVAAIPHWPGLGARAKRLENLCEWNDTSSGLSEWEHGLTTSGSDSNGGSGDEDAAFQLSEFLAHQLIAASRRVTRVLSDRYDEAFGLTVAEVSVLVVVAESGSLSPTGIADAASMDKVRVSRASASLVAKGLLRQARDPDDGRGRLLRLTRKGQGVNDGIGPVAREFEAMLTGLFNKPDQTNLRRILARLNGALDAIDGRSEE